MWRRGRFRRRPRTRLAVASIIAISSQLSAFSHQLSALVGHKSQLVPTHRGRPHHKAPRLPLPKQFNFLVQFGSGSI